jgi:PilZ domain
MNAADRRQFPRIKAPVFCRPAGLRFGNAGETLDISLGGARVYSDDETAPRTPLELELIFADNSSVVCRAEVVWIERLPSGAPARFDVGLRFTELAGDAAAQLARVLSPEE